MRRNCASQVTFRKSATRSERACAFLGAVCLPAFLGLLTLTPLPDCVQDHRRGVVIVRHLALSSLPDQLFPGRLDRFCRLLDLSPIASRPTWDPQTLLRLLEPMEGHPAP